MKRLLSVLALALSLAQAAPDETARLNAWFEAKFEEQLAFSPIQQTFLGHKSDAIDDASLAAQDAQLAWRRATVAELRKTFDYAKLTPEAQTSYDIWIYQLEQAEAALGARFDIRAFHDTILGGGSTAHRARAAG